MPKALLRVLGPPSLEGPVGTSVDGATPILAALITYLLLQGRWWGERATSGHIVTQPVRREAVGLGYLKSSLGEKGGPGG